MADMSRDAEGYGGMSAMISAFFHCLDTEDADTAAAMFAPDAPLDMGVAGYAPVTGPEGVRAMMKGRPDGLVIRHHWSSLHVRSVTDSVDAMFQFTVYGRPVGPVAPPTSVSIGEVEILCDRRGPQESWRFLSMRRTVVFAQP